MPDIVHQELFALDDHDLLLGGVVATVIEARAAAEKLARLYEYFRRRLADVQLDEQGDLAHDRLGEFPAPYDEARAPGVSVSPQSP